MIRRENSCKINLFLAAALYAAFFILAPVLTELALKALIGMGAPLSNTELDMNGPVSSWGLNMMLSTASYAILSVIVLLYLRRIGVLAVGAEASMPARRVYSSVEEAKAGELVRDSGSSIEHLLDRRRYMFMILMFYAGALFAHGVSVSIMKLLTHGSFSIDEGASSFASLGVQGTLITVVCTVLVTPCAEELLLRGMFYGGLRGKNMAFLPAAAFSSILFAGAHREGSQIITAFIIGMLLAFIYEYFGSLLLVILLHIAHNALILVYPKALLLDMGSPVSILILILSGAATVYLALRIRYETINSGRI